ncbi:MAG: L,D-transpeptidase family protein [Thiogranum sp.]
MPGLLHTLVSTIFPASGLLAALWASPTAGKTFPLPPVDIDLIGQATVVKAKYEDTLLDIARRFDIGQDEIVLANTQVDRWLPGEGTEVVIPSRYILPRAERSGIVLNVPEMRMYYFPPAEAGVTASVETYPVSIGRMNWTTPLGTTKVVAKTRDPGWRPPESIRAEAAEKGTPLPDYIPPGPDNPLGRYALRLGIPGYLIHSTNRPFGVGMRVTHGCVRMYPEDIEGLFPDVPVGTPVQIVNQPVKIGWLFDTLFIEIHPPLEEQSEAPGALLETAMDLINAAWMQRHFVLDTQALKAAVNRANGIPLPIARAKSN